MRLLSGLLDRLLLLIAVGAAGVLPAFVQQYRQRLAGRLDQLNEDLAAWRQIAERLHQGDMQALIRHHRDSGDPTFVAGGDAVHAMLQHAAELEAALAAMQGSLPAQIAGWLQHLRWNDVEATWALFQPQFPMDPQGLLFALVGGGLLWLLLLGSALAGASAWRQLGLRRARRRRLRS
jgi:hypothetical protein